MMPKIRNIFKKNESVDDAAKPDSLQGKMQADTRQAVDDAADGDGNVTINKMDAEFTDEVKDPGGPQRMDAEFTDEVKDPGGPQRMDAEFTDEVKDPGGPRSMDPELTGDDAGSTLLPETKSLGGHESFLKMPAGGDDLGGDDESVVIYDETDSEPV